MTTTDDRDAGRRRATTRSPFDETYRWTCPYCGTSRANRSDGTSGKEQALAALRSHVLASRDDGHGSRNELPDDGDDAPTLSDHVVSVDGESPEAE